MSPRASGIAREVQPGEATGVASRAATAHPAARTARTAQRSGGRDRTSLSGERDVGRALVLAAVRVDEGDLHGARRRRLQRERERRILAHALREVEGDDGLAEVGGGDARDVVVVAVDDLALRVALDALHGMDHEAADADDVAGLHAGRHADADLADVAHPSAPAAADGD